MLLGACLEVGMEAGSGSHGIRAERKPSGLVAGWDAAGRLRAAHQRSGRDWHSRDSASRAVRHRILSGSAEAKLRRMSLVNWLRRALRRVVRRLHHSGRQHWVVWRSPLRRCKSAPAPKENPRELPSVSVLL
jgi:hypothetical protein